MSFWIILTVFFVAFDVIFWSKLFADWACQDDLVQVTRA